MTARDAAIAVALRRMQWRCDELAFRAGAGELTPDEAIELSDELADLAAAMRRYGNTAVVLDAEPDTRSRSNG